MSHRSRTSNRVFCFFERTTAKSRSKPCRNCKSQQKQLETGISRLPPFQFAFKRRRNKTLNLTLWYLNSRLNPIRSSCASRRAWLRVSLCISHKSKLPKKRFWTKATRESIRLRRAINSQVEVPIDTIHNAIRLRVDLIQNQSTEFRRATQIPDQFSDGLYMVNFRLLLHFARGEHDQPQDLVQVKI